MDSNPVLVAERLLELVKRIYAPTDSDTPQLSPFEAHETKYEVEDLCGQLLRSVLGPLAYTALLAGKPSKLGAANCCSKDTKESCQESSALGFVTELGVADLLGERSMTVQDISQALGVRPKYLSECYLTSFSLYSPLNVKYQRLH